MAEVADGNARSVPLSRLFAFSLFAFCGLFAASALSAWAGPTQSPPNGNVPAPVNVGTVSQIKDGSLGLKSLAVFGQTLFSGGSVTYTNYGTVSGSDGYGIRDNNGVMEYKNKNGTWTPFSGGGTPLPPTSPGTRVFTYDTPGTYTWQKPSGNYSLAIVQCWGGGGGGGPAVDVGGGESFGGNGGGGGGYAKKTFQFSAVPSSVAVTVGAGGTGILAPFRMNTTGPKNTTTGGNGGASSFGTYLTAYGGGGGGYVAMLIYGGFQQIKGTGGNAVGGDINERGGDGVTFSDAYNAAKTPHAACAGAGGGVGATRTGDGDSLARPGGKSGCGGNGGTGGSLSGIGENGSTPGGGGGGAGYYKAGSGAPGKCVIELR